MSVYEQFIQSKAPGQPPIKPRSVYEQFLQSKQSQPTFGEKALQQFPSTIESLAELQTDPLSLKAIKDNPLNFVYSAGKAIKDIFVKEAESAANFVASFTSEGRPTSEKIGTGLELIGSSAGVVFSPITALFAGAKDIPILGSVARVIELPFVASGEAGAKAGEQLIDHLPISQEAKNKIKPGVQEIFALAGQIALGKAGEVVGKKVLPSEIAKSKIAELTKKYGAEDAKTIVEKAKDLAKEREVRVRLEPEELKVEAPKEIIAEKPKKETKPTIPSELAQEARKYKSAEEFVKSRSPFKGYSIADEFGATSLYHETDPNTAFNLVRASQDKRGLFVSADIDFALGQKGKGAIVEFEPHLFTGVKNKKPAQEFVEKTSGVKEIIIEQGGFDPTKSVRSVIFKSKEAENAAKIGRKSAKDFLTGNVLKFSREEMPNGWIRYINPKSSKSQLTDIWNQATGGVKEKPVVPPIKGTGQIKIRGLAKGVEAKAVENRLTKGFGELPEYRTVSMKDQAQKATDLVNKDFELAKKIAMGEEAPPRGLLPESVFNAVEEKAIKEADVNTLRDLATISKLTSEATTMGQRIRTLAERDPDSAVGAISEVVKAREEAVKSRIKNIDKVKKETAEAIKKEIKKTSPTKETWSSFVDSIQC